MAFENISTDDFFPLFKQTLADSFKVDSFFMHAPYHDFEKMDMGLRRMVWGEYSTNSPIFSISRGLSLSYRCLGKHAGLLQYDHFPDRR